MRKPLRLSLSITILSLALAANAQGQDRTPLEEFIEGFPIELSNRTMDADLPVWLSGGDESVYFAMRTSEILQTAVLPQRTPTRELGQRLMPEIGAIEAETENFGTLTLNEFLARPDGYAQAYIVVHRGDVVFESYPRMRPTDNHVWMSAAKPTAALTVEMLISDGRIDEKASMSDYIEEFRGTPWDNVTVNNVLNMSSGLNVGENTETRDDPDSIATRVFRAEFNLPYNGEVERLIDVLADAEFEIDPGMRFDYASGHTQALVLLVEAVTGERWHQTFDREVWSKMGVEAPMLVHTTPDGVAIAHGVISSRLRDMARFGMLYTPSWSRIATEQIVTDDIMERIQSGV